MAIIKNHRLEYEVGQIDVTYPKNDKATYFGSVPVIVPNNWTPWLCVKKGDLISLEGKQYRVLKKFGSIVEVLAMYNASRLQKFDEKTEPTNVYANNSLDVYLSQAFYNSLSTTMKNAIVAKTFQQDEWYWNLEDSAIANYVEIRDSDSIILSLISMTYGDLISRKCYALSCQDIIDYLEVTTSMTAVNTTLTYTNILKMFWNQTAPIPGTFDQLWLRSVAQEPGELPEAMTVTTKGDLNCQNVNTALIVRPAFQIDLSKIDFKE
nr:MAG TPA: hypothetical protein [Caudoviricetes sp.]